MTKPISSRIQDMQNFLSLDNEKIGEVENSTKFGIQVVEPIFEK